MLRIVTILATGFIAVLLYNAYAGRKSTAGGSGDGRTIFGRVVTAGGEVPEGLWIRAAWRGADGVRSASVPIMANGTFAVPDLEPGRYLLTTKRKDGDAAGTAPLQSGFTTVVVTDTDLRDVVLETKPAVDVIARTRFDGADGKRPPVSVVARLIVPGFGEADSVPGVAQPDGSIVFRDLFGPRVMRPASSMSGWRIATVRFDGADVTGEATDFAARAGAPLEITFASSQSPASR